ncbi:hypothetical protein Nepgr_018403 [Nepenthes gracilis]|uniref:OVATE domain-containing protein n=1 Tax=Nepenthes gracilis TaxID=150966 RepID=A0AAD3STZ7_NEPGR|nr:hypothetical protein Nepgr_018403 [Nepenthes gracilis]
MLLRNSISNTKKFFQKTLENFKSFLSRGQSFRCLPKRPPFNPFSCGRRPDAPTDIHSGRLNPDSLHGDSGGGIKMKGRDEKKMAAAEAATEQVNREVQYRETLRYCNGRKDFPRQKREARERERRMVGFGSRAATRERRLGLAAQRLKVLEMVDRGDVDHGLDIEEVLYYYSRLTCPAYLDIADRFFSEMFAEFLSAPAAPNGIR